MKKLLLLGSNTGSLEIAQYVRNRGDYLIVTDYYPKEKSPAKQIADETWDISTTDIDQLYEKCIENSVQGVLSSTGEANLKSAMELAERLQLPFYVNSRCWNTVNNKIKFKETCKKYGIPVPKDFSESDPLEDEFPIVVKPADNCLNRGLSICREISELPSACAYAYENSLAKNIIIEKFVKGIQVNVFYHMVNGEIYLSTVMKSVTNPGTPESCYAVTYNNPENTERYLEKYDEKVRTMMKELGCRNGTAIVQAIESQGEMYFLEMNYRLDGLGFFQTLKEASGIDAVKIITDVSLDGKTDFIPVSYRKENEGVYCIYSLWTYKTCRIDKIKGVREIQEILPDLHFQMVCEEGMETEVVPGTGAMMMNISFCRKSQKEISETIREINRMVFVYDQENKDILAKFTGDL